MAKPGTVHLIIGMSRSGKVLEVVTGCGQGLLLAAPSGALVDAGVSVWQSDITCTDCMARRVEKQMADPVPTEFGVVRPGDTLIVRYSTEHKLSQAQVADIAQAMKEKMPKDITVVVTVADEIVVHRPGEEPT